MLTETPTQTLATIQLKEKMNAGSYLFGFLTLTLFYLDIIQQHHNR